MLKKFSAWFVLLAVAAPVFLGAVTDNPNKPPIFSVGNPSYASGPETGTVTVDYHGNILPGKNLAQDLGESTHAFKTVYTGQLDVSSGILNQLQEWRVPNSSAATGYGSFSVSTTNLVNAGTTFAVIDLVQSTVPRNIVLQSSFTAGMSTTTVIATATVVGVNALGQQAIETIYFSTRQTAGNVAWAFVSSITIRSSSVSITGEANTVFKVGTGNKLGIINDVTNSSDCYKIATSSGIINLTDPGVSVDTTYDTIDFGQNIPNGVRNFWVWYRARRSAP